MIGKYAKRKPVICNLVGMYTANAFIPGAVVVLHAPRPCSHLIASALPGLEERYRKSEQKLPFHKNNLYVTGLSDKEAIFGGEKKLEECLRTVIEARHPSYVMVAGGCVAGVIGDDIAAVCRRVEEDTKVPILHTDGCGFMNDTESDPYILTTKLLIERFGPLQNTGAKDKTVAMLGEMPVNSKRFEISCIRALFRYFGFTDVLFPLAGMEIAELPLLNRVSLAVAGRGQSYKKREICSYTRYFAETLGIPYILDHLPETPLEVYAYLKMLGELLEEPALAGKAVEQEKAQIDCCAAECRSVFQKKNCLLAFVFSYDFAMPERKIALLEAAGISVSGFILLPEMSETEKEKYRKALRGYEKPVYSEEEYLQQKPAEDFVVTIIEKPYFPKQFITTKRHIGAAGICDFWKQMKRFLELDRRMFHEE